MPTPCICGGASYADGLCEACTRASIFRARPQSEEDARVLKIRIEVEALVTLRESYIIENKIRESNGDAPAYGEGNFHEICDGLEDLRKELEGK